MLCLALHLSVSNLNPASNIDSIIHAQQSLQNHFTEAGCTYWGIFQQINQGRVELHVMKAGDTSTPRFFAKACWHPAMCTHSESIPDIKAPGHCQCSVCKQYGRQRKLLRISVRVKNSFNKVAVKNTLFNT